MAAFLAALAVLVPVDAADVPDTAELLVGVAAAGAQTPGSVVTVPADPCPPSPLPIVSDPSDWSVGGNDNSLCILTIDACPISPLAGALWADRLTPSTDYLGFCDTRLFDTVADLPLFTECSNHQGFARLVDTRATPQTCRIVAPSRCRAGTFRINATQCRHIQRRTWTCAAGDVPTNIFGQCYRAGTQTSTAHPACGTGAPSFATIECATYVGTDYVSSPNCAAFTNNPPLPTFGTHSNRHWCTYNSELLRVECHTTGANCSTTLALCIQRVSKVGGCDGVDETIRCRGLQAQALPAEDLITRGCDPCPALPFRPLPATCPAEMSRAPTLRPRAQPPQRLVLSSSIFDMAHQVQRSIDVQVGACQSFETAFLDRVSLAAPSQDCQSLVICGTPPRGTLEWNTTHTSGLAFANSPVVLDVIGLPNTRVPLSGFIISEYTWNRYKKVPVTRAGGYALGFPNPGGNSHALSMWPSIAENEANDSVPSMFDLDHDPVAHRENRTERGECIVKDRPDFRLVITEMLPDDADTEELFGAQALAWWNAMSQSDQRSFMQRHYPQFAYMGDLTSAADIDTERANRAEKLTQIVRCNHASVGTPGTEPAEARTWCRWTPLTTGYFRIVAAGGWKLQAYTSVRKWRDNTRRNLLNEFLADLSDSPSQPSPEHIQTRDERCRKRLRSDRHNQLRADQEYFGDFECLMEYIGIVDPTPPDLVDPSEDPDFARKLQRYGLEYDTVGDTLRLLPAAANNELFQNVPNQEYQCPPIDLRMLCGSFRSVVTAYTESVPIGIAVHEARVVTRAPS